MKTYLISLTPVGKYFFGGDLTFEVQDEQNPDIQELNEQYGSYIIHSEKFPQQTSILGMLRYLILSTDNTVFDRARCKVLNAKDASVLIGEKGFRHDCREYADYGVLSSFSACFLQVKKDDKWASLLPTPADMHISQENNTCSKVSLRLDFTDKIVCYNKDDWEESPVVSKYDYKKGINSGYVDKDGDIYLDSDIFVEDVRIGITKNYKGITSNKSFYKMISYRLGKYDEFRFALYVMVDDQVDLSSDSYKNVLVSLGGDDSRFIFNVEKIVSDQENNNYDENTQIDPSNFSTETKVVLLSDAYIPCMPDVKFAITSLVPFRYLQTETKENADYSSRKKDLRCKSRFYLYKRGSVFYCTKEQMERLGHILREGLNFHQIGYNQYQVINKK